MELLKTYKSKKKLVHVITSLLFQRRLEEAEAVVENAITGLQVSAMQRKPPFVVTRADRESGA